MPDRRPFDPFGLARPVLHRLDPETAHELTLRALEANLVPPQPEIDDPMLATTLFGRALAHPVGLAAGFDKNGRVFRKMYAQGFSFVEVGGITPQPQRGNKRPRVFRLPADEAAINKMGFPNDGVEAVLRRVRGEPPAGMLGINLASNADSPDPVADFVDLVGRCALHADYLTLDISCPNTGNGQVFLDPGRLRELLDRIGAVDRGAHPPALAAKLSPDIESGRLEELIDVLLSAKIDGLVIGNTTAQRPPLQGDGSPAGGLSGRPLLAMSTAQLARVATLTGGAVPLIGVGGIARAADAYAKIRAGASAVQLYTALIYGGTALVTRMKRELAIYLLRDGFERLSDAVGADRGPRRIPV